MLYYIYRFLNQEKEVIYVGKTNKLRVRFSQHEKDKIWWNEVKYIEYTTIGGKLWCSIYEVYYINKTKAKYNKADTNIKYKKFNYPELSFKPYI